MADGSLLAEAQADTIKCENDFAYFARRCLKIRTKSGELKPFIFNRAQRFLHEEIEDQMGRVGAVRKLIVKGRQLGSSTYIEGRFYWRNWKAKKGTSLKAYILTHNQDATDNLFGMAQRFHDNMPAPLQPATKAANAKQLIFSDTECGYTVATAGTKEVGRSDTIQLFHGSEVPSWPNAKEHFTSLVTTALAKTKGTEGYLESTAKGVGDVFHLTAEAAIRGDSEYEAVFIPWFWDEGYQESCPEAWAAACPTKWQEYGALHKLDWEQLYWAFLTNRTLAKAHSLPDDEPCWAFKQEYPATFDEAFQSSGNSFIPALSVTKARQKRVGSDQIVGRGPIILGLDPAAQRDKFGIIDRCGRVAGSRISERWAPNADVEYVGAKVSAIINRIRPDAVNIDTSEGFGAALYAWLCNHGHAQICNAVHFGGAPVGCGPTGDELYANRRSEMWDVMREWFETVGGVQIPDDNGLHADITSAQWGPGQTRRSPTNNELIIEPKDKIRERLGASPDLGDSLALTFAVPFAEGMMAQNQPRPQRRGSRHTGY